MSGEKGRDSEAPDRASGVSPDAATQRRGEGGGVDGPARWETSTWAGGVAPPIIRNDLGSLTTSRPRLPMCLVRIEPALVRGERVGLDPKQSPIQIGRAESSDIRLYTASGSRKHASVTCDEAGEWILTPAPGSHVLIDGYPAPEPVALETDMNIVLGEDHFRCVMNEALLAEEEVTEIEGASRDTKRAEWMKKGGLAVAGLVLLFGAIAAIWLGFQD